MRLLHIRSSRTTLAKDNHYHRCDVYAVFVALFLLQVLDPTTTSGTHGVVNALSSITPRGCAAKPLDKKKVVVLGVGGFLGSMTFGFLQRSSTLYGTGIGQVRAMAACGDSASRLNRVLSKQFVLAFADESYIKLTDLTSIDFIVQRLQGFNALILGNELEVLQRPVTGGSYEKTPNDKVYEVYWPTLAGSVSIKNENESEALERIREQLLDNILQAAKRTGTIQHIVALTNRQCDDDGNGNDSFLSHLKDCGIPYTCLHPTGPWARVPDYTFRKGIQTDLQIQTMMSENDKTSSSSAAEKEPIAMEDMAALCVQCLQSLDWTTSRHLRVSCQGPVTPAMIERATTTTALSRRRPPKRPDQEWCVNSSILERALQSIR